MYDEIYVPLCEMLDVFGLSYRLLDKTYLIGDRTVLDSFKTEYEISECISSSFKTDNLEITDADFEAAIQNVKRMYLGEDNDMSNPVVYDCVKRTESAGAQWYKEMNTDKDATELWADISPATNRGVRAQNYAKRITEMAITWGTEGSEYYKNDAFLEKTLYALEWFYTNIYNMGNPDILNQTGGWFYWNYGTPNELLPGLFVLSDVLTAEYMSRYLEVVDYINPSSVGGTTGDQEVFADENKLNVSGNKCWQLRIALWSAILQRQPERVAQEVNVEIRRLFEYTEHVRNGKFHQSVPTNWNGEDNKNGGFYADGSYIDHQYYPYIAGYGANYFGVMATVFRSLKNTSMFPSDPIMHNQVEWLKNALAPLVWKNNVYWRTKGRNIKVEGAIASTGLSHFVIYYLDMLDYLTGDDREFVKRLIKTQGQYMGYIITTAENTLLFNEIMQDDTITALEDEEFSKVFFNMAAVAHQRDDYKFYLTMNSTEIGYAEIYTYSGENFYGFHQSDGHTSVLTKDGAEYDGYYWNNVDPTKLAGVTSIERPFDRVTGSICYAGTDFVGGTTLDNKYTVAAMDFYGHNRGKVTREDNATDAYYSDLAAHKSWFMFDDEIVCLGSGISNTENYEAITTIESRRIYGQKELKTPGTIAQIEAKSVTSCGSDGNVAENTIDYNFSSRWSYDGTDGWLEYDLGGVKDLGYLGIAFYSGKTRRTKIKILTSIDKNTWTEHFNGESSGTTEDLEVYPVNKKARYVKMECYGNSAGSNWNSISEVQFYPQRSDGQTPVNQRPPFVYGTDDIWVDGNLLEKTDFSGKKIENVKYVNVEGAGGYYFPQETDLIFNKYTKGSIAIADFYTSHGLNPVDEKYAYAILPTMTKEETQNYAKNPRFTVLMNEKNIQSVRHNDLGITGTVFWEKGETDTLSADIPCVVNLYRDDNTVKLAIADPSKLSDSANIKVKLKNLVLKQAGECITVTKDAEGYQNINIDFTTSNDPAFKGRSYRGNTYIVEFTANGSMVGNISSSGTSSDSKKNKETVAEQERVKGFKDLGGYAWAEDAVNDLCEKGIISKSEDGCFRPADSVKREEFIKMLVEVFEIPMADEASGFSDSSRDAWYEAYLSSAKKSGITQGREDGSFGVGDEITRQDMAVMILRAIQNLGISLNFDYGKEAFKDESSISGYALEAVQKIQQAGFINGMGDGYFAPREKATRAQAAVIIKRILEAITKGGN